LILSALVAMSKNRVIGADNKLPWDLPEDMAFFREQSKGSIMIMGRKTFDSMGRVLPGRFHIVITRTPQAVVSHERVLAVTSLAEALEQARLKLSLYRDEVFLIGGAEIFAQGLDSCDKIYLTVIDMNVEGQSLFPKIPAQKFRLASQRAGLTEGPKLDFQTWEKI
jgi:dihydrofolate reductase